MDLGIIRKDFDRFQDRVFEVQAADQGSLELSEEWDEDEARQIFLELVAIYNDLIQDVVPTGLEDAVQNTIRAYCLEHKEEPGIQLKEREALESLGSDTTNALESLREISEVLAREVKQQAGDEEAQTVVIRFRGEWIEDFLNYIHANNRARSFMGEDEVDYEISQSVIVGMLTTEYPLLDANPTRIRETQKKILEILEGLVEC
ncbi:MAG: hypothetical protein D6812_16940 [Deltaproteobacteria bacterium]|nr:MAG: hypothetical protein D6812_16940 [Deltaproteobacteria bacterium]